MKKTILALAFLFLAINFGLPQMKMQFTIDSAKYSAGFFTAVIDVQVLAGQTWHVGASNLRVNDTVLPGNTVMTVQADNPAVNANTNISNANGYQAMTTTSVASGVSIGLNILTFNTNGFYSFAPGKYRLGRIRWSAATAPPQVKLSWRVTGTGPTAVFDSTVAMVNGTNYTLVNPTITSEYGQTLSIPSEYKLHQNYPNPFNPTTNIKFDLPKDSKVSLKIYDLKGSELANLVETSMTAGSYDVDWNASKYASGVYFCRLVAGDYVQTNRMVLVK